MNLSDGLLSPGWLWLGHVLYVVTLVASVYGAPWRRLGESELLHVYLGACVALMILWTIKAGVSPGLSFHYLGATLLTLMFGWPLAVVGTGVVLLAATVSGMSGWQAFSLNGLLMGALPAAVSLALFHATVRWLPHNLFVYIFVCGFFGAAAAMATTGAGATLLLAASGAYTFDHLANHYLPFFLLMVFPEAIITGSAITLMVVYRPRWVWTYDEDRYLGDK